MAIASTSCVNMHVLCDYATVSQECLFACWILCWVKVDTAVTRLDDAAHCRVACEIAHPYTPYVAGRPSESGFALAHQGDCFTMLQLHHSCVPKPQVKTCNSPHLHWWSSVTSWHYHNTISSATGEGPDCAISGCTASEGS